MIHVTIGTPEQLSQAVALEIASAIQNFVPHHEFLLGTATGSTPERLYVELEKLLNAARLSFERVRCFGLDEYCGISASHPQSYHTFMLHKLWEPMRVRENCRHLPDADSPAAYENLIRHTGGGVIDFQILGIGHNGHIAFNEPGSAFDSRTRKVALDERTREANARFFNSLEEVPTHAVTMGLGTIMEASRICLMAFGVGKAAAVKAALEGPMSTDCPASVLQTHPRVQFFLDEAAASLLTLPGLHVTRM